VANRFSTELGANVGLDNMAAQNTAYQQNIASQNAGNAFTAGASNTASLANASANNRAYEFTAGAENAESLNAADNLNKAGMYAADSWNQAKLQEDTDKRRASESALARQADAAKTANTLTTQENIAQMGADTAAQQQSTALQQTLVTSVANLYGRVGTNGLLPEQAYSFGSELAKLVSATLGVELDDLFGGQQV
jgi:hypothetical protein